ncbi:MAG: DUF87 domain-containing protein [Desulfoprunum sp.]|nr:DUF87 domain-containing protein [Desulfoprunum sp.]
MDAQYPYEKLGLFYLGRELDVTTHTPAQAPLLFKSKDLTTHAAIIGMTGSGKTGLGIGLIEEAIIDNIPSIIIDPKGDMGNLLLAFPELRPEDFLPWIDPSDAARKEMTVEAYAEATAKDWQAGLQGWGQSKERIKNLLAATTMTIYTPGSSSGVPVSVLSSFQAPSAEVANDTDTFNGLVNSTTVSLLALIGVEGDPLQSREHILLSSILIHFWRKAESLSLEGLIGNIVNPPFTKIGVFPLDTFYPQTQRMSLAMSLNGLLASPTFAAWIQGEPLDIQRILYSEDGRPKTAIFSISHLSESERMFFVTMLLNQIIGWMRRQQGTASLKALLYMDEIFGYFPPTANPPSKKPMLLLLKQARAYGLGVVLSTQNPVDLDYKGLSNIGTWFVGRLQTSQDQERVLDGIVGASDGKLDRQKVKELLSDMKGRQFLLTSAHLDAPLLFESRWVLSYLRGPLATTDIKKLMQGRTNASGTLETAPSNTVAVSAGSGSATAAFASSSELPNQAPLVSQGIEQLYFLHNITAERLVFEPWLAATASVRFANSTRNIDIVRESTVRIYLDEAFARAEWAVAEACPCPFSQCTVQPPSNSSFYALPTSVAQLKDFRELSKSFTDHLYQNQKLDLFRVAALKLESQPNESLGDFKVRLADVLRERKNAEIEKLRQTYGLRQNRLEDQMRAAMDRVEKEKVDVASKTTDTVISFGAAVIGAFLGRKAFSASTVARAATGMRSAGRVVKEKGDVQRAEIEVQDLQQELNNLAAEIEQKVVALADSFNPERLAIETFSIKPRRSDVFNVRLALLWEMVPERNTPAAS